MYGSGQDVAEKELAYANQIRNLGTPYIEPTIGENIERQIKHHVEAINRLEITRQDLAKANLLDLKISNLREAMSY
jgi:hypothetical protein